MLPFPATFFKAASAVLTYFKALSYTGNGGTQSITGAGFSPDMVMTFTGAQDTAAYDTTRGTTKFYNPPRSDTETTNANSLTAFGSDGFSVGTAAMSNQNAQQYRAWLWKKLTGFFDIVTYTGDGSSTRNISHALGAAPSLILVKRLNVAANTTMYSAYADATSPQNFDYNWNTTNYTKGNSNLVWNNTAPTASVFTTGSDAKVNANTGTYVAYLFADSAGKAKAGTYTGTGATGNAITGLGFTPSMVLIIRRTPSSSDIYWNYAAGRTTLNNSGSEMSTVISLDADGFTVNTTDANYNTSGQTYIYYAWK